MKTISLYDIKKDFDEKNKLIDLCNEKIKDLEDQIIAIKSEKEWIINNKKEILKKELGVINESTF